LTALTARRGIATFVAFEEEREEGEDCVHDASTVDVKSLRKVLHGNLPQGITPFLESRLGVFAGRRWLPKRQAWASDAGIGEEDVDVALFGGDAIGDTLE